MKQNGTENCEVERGGTCQTKPVRNVAKQTGVERSEAKRYGTLRSRTGRSVSKKNVSERVKLNRYGTLRNKTRRNVTEEHATERGGELRSATGRSERLCCPRWCLNTTAKLCLFLTAGPAERASRVVRSAARNCSVFTTRLGLCPNPTRGNRFVLSFRLIGPGVGIGRLFKKLKGEHIINYESKPREGRR